MTLWLMIPWGVTLLVVVGIIMNAKGRETMGQFFMIVGLVLGLPLHLAFVFASIGGYEREYLEPDIVARNDTHLVVSYGKDAITTDKVRLYKADDSEIYIEQKVGINAYGYHFPYEPVYSVVLAGDVEADKDS